MTVEGHIENGQIVLGAGVSLPEGSQVRVEVLRGAESQHKSESTAGTQFEHYESIIGAVDDLPNDFAANHDHYIHGTPKK